MFEKLGMLKNTGVEIYRTKNDNFVIVSKLSDGFTCGEVTATLYSGLILSNIDYFVDC